jgi:hypothetical protein
MNTILIPIFLFSNLITGIQIAKDQVIDSTLIMAGTKADADYLAFTPDKFILLKTIIEAKADDCKEAIKDSISVCQYQLDVCHSSCDSTPKHYKDMIKTLQYELVSKESDIEALTKHNTALKYIAIVAGSIALSSGAYILFK